MATTESNLKDAFAGESQANRKYLAFAQKAEQEGYRNVARLFRTAAEAETVHAHGHLRALSGVGATAETCGRRSRGRLTNTPKCTRRCCSRRLPMTTRAKGCLRMP